MCDAFNALTIGCAIGYPSSALLSMYKDPNFEVTEEQVHTIDLRILRSVSSFQLDSNLKN